jgi:hypothetical protein
MCDCCAAALLQGDLYRALIRGVADNLAAMCPPAILARSCHGRPLALSGGAALRSVRTIPLLPLVLSSKGVLLRPRCFNSLCDALGGGGLLFCLLRVIARVPPPPPSPLTIDAVWRPGAFLRCCYKKRCAAPLGRVLACCARGRMQPLALHCCTSRTRRPHVFKLLRLMHRGLRHLTHWVCVVVTCSLCYARVRSPLFSCILLHTLHQSRVVPLSTRQRFGCFLILWSHLISF